MSEPSRAELEAQNAELRRENAEMQARLDAASSSGAGANVTGDVNTARDFVGRDKNVGRDKVGGNVIDKQFNLNFFGPSMPLLKAIFADLGRICTSDEVRGTFAEPFKETATDEAFLRGALDDLPNESLPSMSRTMAAIQSDARDLFERSAALRNAWELVGDLAEEAQSMMFVETAHKTLGNGDVFDLPEIDIEQALRQGKVILKVEGADSISRLSVELHPGPALGPEGIRVRIPRGTCVSEHDSGTRVFPGLLLPLD